MLKHAFIAITGVVLLWIAIGSPIRSAYRRREFRLTLYKAWAGSVAYLFFVSFLVPGLVSLFDEELAKVMLRSWVPDGRGVIAMIFVGWIQPMIGFVLGAIARWIVDRRSV